MTARKELIFVEIDVSTCDLTYGMPPCIAARAGDVLPRLSYNFRGSNNGFSANDCTLTSTAVGMVMHSLGAVDPFFSSPAISVSGSTHRVVQIEIERLTEGTGTWKGLFFYSTAGHPFSGSYYKNFPDIPLGKRVVIELDMSALTAGGTDWISNTITGFRVDLDGVNSAGTFRIYSIKLGRVAVLPADAAEVTGTAKCFNTVGSCQDRAHYTETFVTLRFVKDVGYQAESGIEAIPCLASADLEPGRISLGENLGQRPEVVCTFVDAPHSDTGQGFDKYPGTRTYNPFEQGTLWAKIWARHPNLRGKRQRVIQGYLGQTLAEMETRHYIIDSVEPPLDGQLRTSAMDPLRSTDGERAQAPAVSTGFLNASLNTSATSATLTPAGIGNAEYPSSGFLNLSGEEIVSFTRAADALTIVRGQKGTAAVAHDAGDRAQLCLSYTAQDPAVIIRDLLVTYGGVDASYVPLTDWQAETAAYNSQVYTGFIPEPTAVKDVVAELIEQAGLAIWWDEIEQKLRLQVLRQIPTDAFVFDESLYRDGSLRITGQPDKRLSQVWTYFAGRNPLKADDLANYPGIAVLENTDAEADYGSPAVKTIISRWIPAGGRLIAERLNEIQLGRFLIPPREVEFELIDAEGTELPQLGGGYRLSAPTVQGVDGARAEIPFQVTRLKRDGARYVVTGEEVNWTDLQSASDPFNRIITVDYNSYNLNIRSLHDALYGAPTPKGTVTLILASTARIGSTSTSVPALETGTWPSQAFTATRSTSNGVLTGISNTSAFEVGQAVTGPGIPNDARVLSMVLNTSVTIDKTPTIAGSASLTLWTTIVKLIAEGQIIGKGGNGGRGQAGDNKPGLAGQAGGSGLKATAPIEVSGAGKIDGGGGGGGSAQSDYSGWLGPQINGGGGGGGAGDLAGNGGDADGSGAAPGSPGTLNAGGAGGKGSNGGWNGGAGGSPGANGSSSTGGNNGPGGAAGKSVEGDALLKDTAFTGAYRGPKTA